MLQTNSQSEKTETMSFITPEQHMESPVLYKRFSLAGAVRQASLCITGLGLYRAFLNGVRVGEDYLTPGFNDYDAYLRCQTYDVTALLQEENCLEVYLGNGWYKGRFGFGGGEDNRWGTQYLLAARLTAQRTDAPDFVLDTDTSWQCRQSFLVENNIYDGETRDDTRACADGMACVAAPAPCLPEQDMHPPVRCHGVRKPVLLSSPSGETVLDFGQNFAGIVRFTSRLHRGETMRLQFGEVLQNGCFYRDNLRTAKAQYTYVSDGVEKEVEPYFTFFGFRYALVESPRPVDVNDFAGLVLYSNLTDTLSCETDNPKINRLMQNAVWGQRSNFVDVPTDCPQRDERLGWTADTQVFVNTACYHMDCKAFYTKYMRDLRAEQTRYYGGDIPMYAPSLKGGAGKGGAVWADAGTIIPWHVYRHYGDKALLAETYPMMRDYTETLIAADTALGASHVKFDSFTFGDWLAQDGITPQSLKGGTEDAYIQSVYYWNSVRLTSLAARELDENDDAQRYTALAEEIRAAILREYFSETGRLCVDTQTGYVLAVYYGIYRDKEKLLAAFAARLRKDLYKIKTGFTGTPLLLPALFENGMTDIAYKMLYSEKLPGWLYSVNLGATTIWERWNSLLPDGTISGTGMNSLNHYAYGAVCEAIYAHIAGLQCGEHGWKTAVFAPKPHWRMRHIALEFSSPCGRYAIAWQIQQNGELSIQVSVPQGATAKIELPYHPQALVQELGAGEHSFSYQPSVDLLHPFSIQTELGDLLSHPAALDVLQKRLPAIYAAVEREEEFHGQSPLALAYQMPYLNAQNVLDCAKAFEEICVL